MVMSYLFAFSSAQTTETFCFSQSSTNRHLLLFLVLIFSHLSPIMHLTQICFRYNVIGLSTYIWWMGLHGECCSMSNDFEFFLWNLLWYCSIICLYCSYCFSWSFHEALPSMIFDTNGALANSTLFWDNDYALWSNDFICFLCPFKALLSSNVCFWRLKVSRSILGNR